MDRKNSLGRLASPPKTTPPQSPRGTSDVSSSSDEPSAEDGIDGTSPEASTAQATPEGVAHAQGKLLMVPALSLPVTEEEVRAPANLDEEHRCPKGLASYAVWVGAGAAVMAPLVIVAAYLEPGSFDSPPIETHPGWVIPLSALVGGAAGGAMRYLHQRLFG